MIFTSVLSGDFGINVPPPYLCISVVHLVGLDGLPAGLAAVVDHHVELRPGPELPLPVGDGGERRDDQERPLDVFHVNLVEECDRLDGLPQPHLVSQDTVTSAGEGGKVTSSFTSSCLSTVSLKRHDFNIRAKKLPLGLL